MSDPRVRFAPSPTGELHIGGARTALFNYLYIRSVGGKLILRIDDTDLKRSSLNYSEKLIQSLHWLGLKWDEGPYFQSKRIKLYQLEVERLLLEKKAYCCHCSLEEIKEGREKAKRENRPYLYPGTCRSLGQQEKIDLNYENNEFVVRLVTPDEDFTVVNDEIRGKVSFDNKGLDDFIILKSNGLPTYNFASIVDDHDMSITDIIRAEEHLSNTPRQILCAQALGYVLPRFAHVPMILAPDRSKLSKRHGATSVEEFRANGFLPEALINYMALLGWSPGNDLEIFSLEEVAGRFSLSRVNKTAAIYDTDKLTWLNSHYIREYDFDRLADLAKPFYIEAGLNTADDSWQDDQFYRHVIALVRDRAKTLRDLPELSIYFFTDQFEYDENGIKKFFNKAETAANLRRAAIEIESLEYFSSHSVEEVIKGLVENLGISFGKLINPIRLAITGKTGGPGVLDIIILLGQVKTVKRLNEAATYIEKSKPKIE